MKPIFLIYFKKKGSSSRKLISACSSLRSAISLVISQLLSAGEITPQEIGKTRNVLGSELKTQEFNINYEINIVQPNTVQDL